MRLLIRIFTAPFRFIKEVWDGYIEEIDDECC